MRKPFFRSCSLFLVLVLLVNMLPMSIFAEEYQTVQATAAAEAAAQTTDAQIVAEVVENRTEYTKEFKLDNGLFTAAVYSDPVHFLQDGQWKDIDNTLLLRLDGTYANTAGLWDVRLPRQLSQGNPITITKDGYTLSFNMAGELRQQGNLEVAGMEPIEETTALTSSDPISAGGAALTRVGSSANNIAVANIDESAPAVQETISVEETLPEITEETEPETEPEETIPATLPQETQPETQATVPEETEVVDETVPAETIALGSALETTSVTVGGVSQTFAVNAAQTAVGQIQAIDLTEAKKSAEHEEFILEKNASQLLYANVYQNTNVQYDLQGNTVKESIILNSYSSTLRGYRYTLNVGDMVPVLNDDGSIYFYDENKEDIVLVMPAPYLVDDAEECNTDVRVSLTGSGSTYTLIYLLPTSWLASSERAWPVVLDPVVTTKPDTLNIRDHTVASNGSYSYLRQVLECGYGPSSHVQRFFIKYRTLPPLTSSDVIVSATMQLYKPENSDSIVTVDVHKVLGTWESETLTWANKPGFDTDIEDFAVINLKGYYSWDVTDIVRGWYQGENTGMMFKASDQYEDGSASTWKQFCSSDGSAYKPSLTIVFRNNNGIENYWDYTSFSLGRAGTGYINSYTGNMVWVRSDIGFGGNRMPVSISHVYNLNDSDNNSFGMGNGWRTNFNQRVYSKTINGITYYVWEDADGTAHYFYYDSSNTYKDEDGLELTLKTNGSGTKKYSITDKNGNVSYFDTYGRLTSQQNNQKTKSSITVTYTTASGLLIDKITDGAGRVYDFTYSSDLLSTIEYLGSGSKALATSTFTYSSSNLTKITDSDGKASNYTYSGHILTAAQGIQGNKLQYDYYTPSADYQPYRVKKVSEYYGTTAGGTLSMEYAHNQTTFTDHNGNVEIMQFNNFGNTVSIQDNEGHAQYSKFTVNDTDETGNANQLRLSSKLQNTVGNLLKDSSFEKGSTWTVVSGSGSRAVSTGQAYYGSKSLSVTNALEVKSSAVTVAAGQTYTFSAYVKTVGTTAKLTLHNGTTSFASQTLPAGSGWTRLETSYTNTGTASVSVTARLVTSGTGTTYMDCVQLEKAATASRYNLIENGDFRHGEYGWTRGKYFTTTEKCVTSTAAAPELDTNVYCITGSPSVGKHLYQKVLVSGNAGDTFVLAGWAKGDSAPLDTDDSTARQFALEAIFNNTDGTTTKQAIRFNPDTDSSNNWQYVAGAVVADKPYSSVNIDVQYDYNVNAMYFDGIQLYKEEFGNSYTYDADGNVISVKDLQNKTTTYEYNTNGDLAKILQDNKAKMTYTYDSYHNVTKAVSEEGLTYEFAYDAYGNNTSVSIVSGSSKITSTAKYSDDGNTLVSTTDALGNTTTYGYNTITNLLEWVQYPEDTAETRTEYTYTRIFLLASAATTTDTGNSLSATYTYTKDLLTGIQTASTTYSFDCGVFDLRNSVSIVDEESGNSRTLASYTYTDNKNKDLQKLAYGNGDSVQYTYDSKGRVTKQTYEDGSTVTYSYDNNGALATVTDSETGIKTTYYYDFTDRMMKYVESGSGFSHSVGYTYDTLNNLTALVETINGVEHTTSYAYDKDNRITSVTNGSAVKSYTYDTFGRSSTQTTKNGSTTVKTDTFTFKNPTTATTSAQIATHKVTSTGLTKTFSYTYDKNGNILSVSDGTNTTSYVYDSANQLVRENNQAGGFTHTWTYDNAGNILERKEYAYTTGDLGTATDTITYAYEDTNGWGDLLTAYDGQTITYDTIGNPLTDGTWTYTWKHGRQLASMTDGSTTWNYTYNADGLRTKKTDGTTTYQYVYNGSQLSQMTVGSNSLYFAYDASGVPMSVDYNGTTYYYVTNVQGDVIGILNASGALVVSYTYDAWGNILSVEGSLKDTLGTHNPLRYRGYVYDSETKLYYLQSRYYNPEVGRFINGDAQLNPKDGLLGFNMFAFCQNNPILYSDPTGHSIILTCIIVGAVIGAIAGGCAGAYISKKKTGEVKGLAVAAGVVGGGIVGGLLGWGVGAAITAAGAAGAAGAGGTIAQAGNELYNNWQSAEAGLRKAIGSVTDYASRVFSTTAQLGNRVVDAYNTSTKVIAEAKYGYQAFSSFIQSEVARDAYLLQSGVVSEVQWHFYYSQVSGTIGGSYPLIKALLDAGIQVFYH